LEQKPDSAARAAVVAEIVDDQPPEAQHELLTLAETLRAALQSEGKGEAVATMLNQFENHGGTQYNAPGGTQNFGIPPEQVTAIVIALNQQLATMQAELAPVSTGHPA
ncbi:MAG: hypothetical protein ACRCV5_13905, partial [Afipia sp.]